LAPDPLEQWTLPVDRGDGGRTGLAVQISVEGSATTLAVSGEIDVAVADQLLRAAAQAVARAEGDRIVVDLAQVPFIDSTGLGTLVTARRLALARDLSFVVRGVAGRVRRVMDITGLSEPFGLDDSNGPAVQGRRDPSGHLQVGLMTAERRPPQAAPGGPFTDEAVRRLIELAAATPRPAGPWASGAEIEQSGTEEPCAASGTPQQ
jgi:anti-sigma B factor antagonist